MNFAVNRKEMNRGTWVQSGEWLFEEFMFDDNCFGRAKVEYTVDYRPGRNGDAAQIDIENVKVTEIILLDEQLNEVKKWDSTSPLMHFEECEQIATTTIGENLELEVALDHLGMKEAYETIIREAKALYPLLNAVVDAFNDEIDRVTEAEDVNRE